MAIFHSYVRLPKGSLKMEYHPTLPGNLYNIADIAIENGDSKK